jgi:acetyltransferase
MSDQRSSISLLFQPRSVAVVGASASPEKIGSKILQNIVAGGYRGQIYPVNPKGGEVLGLPAVKSLSEIPGGVDLVCIAIPAKLVAGAVEECGRIGAKHLAIITSGFGEVGNLEEERRIVALARQAGMRVIGPNIFGVYSAAGSINATFGPRDVEAGGVAIITQSGALGIAMMGKTKTEKIGLSAVISVGNKSDVDEADLLEYLIDDPNTKVILMYIEGVKDGEKLVRALPAAVARKPVIVLKSGRSKRGAMAAASHTGSLAGADEVFSAIMRQCGVLRAESIAEALNWCKFLAQTPLPQSENTVILTNGGGIGVLATDACEKYDVALWDDVPAMERIFAGAAPDFGSFKNPVDITGQALLKDYENSIASALRDEQVHSLIVLGCETAVLDAANLTATIERSLAPDMPKKPLLYSFFGGPAIENAVGALKAAGRPIFGDVYEAVSCMGALHQTKRNRAIDRGDAGVIAELAASFDRAAIQRVLDGVRADGRRFLLAHEAQALMGAAGVPMPRSIVARSLEQALKAADEIGYPVVMKIVSKDIIHKSDAGGIALDLDNRAEVSDAYEAILHNCRAHNPQAKLEGVEVAEQIAKGTETIVGARRDGSFGPIVMFGLGGIYVEVMKDVSFRALPLSRAEAGRMVKEIKSYPLLLGVRGESQKDIEKLLDAILRVGAVLKTFDEISDIEINPLVVYDQGEGAKAVDARILLRQPAKGASA